MRGRGPKLLTFSPLPTLPHEVTKLLCWLLMYTKLQELTPSEKVGDKVNWIDWKRTGRCSLETLDDFYQFDGFFYDTKISPHETFGSLNQGHFRCNTGKSKELIHPLLKSYVAFSFPILLASCLTHKSTRRNPPHQSDRHKRRVRNFQQWIPMLQSDFNFIRKRYKKPDFIGKSTMRRNEIYAKEGWLKNQRVSYTIGSHWNLSVASTELSESVLISQFHREYIVLAIAGRFRRDESQGIEEHTPGSLDIGQ